jgi:hypothetical protein
VAPACVVAMVQRTLAAAEAVALAVDAHGTVRN